MLKLLKWFGLSIEDFHYGRPTFTLQ